MQIKNVVCEYCSTLNLVTVKSCKACGAPIFIKTPKAIIKSTKLNPKKNTEILSQIKDAGKKTEGAYQFASKAYWIGWRIIGEILAILIISMGLGIIGGVTGTGAWSVFLGVLFGLIIGVINKPYLFMLLSFPMGFLIGTLIGIILWTIGLGTEQFVFVVFVFSSGVVVLGSTNAFKYDRSFYQKVRPFLGGICGLIFSLIGLLIGTGLTRLFNLPIF
jgi:F0F1-type ATP synthase assembly protein I